MSGKIFPRYSNGYACGIFSLPPYADIFRSLSCTKPVFRGLLDLKGHLVNTRVVFAGHGNGKPELMQVTDYYPFGMVMGQQNHFAESELANNYLYNGKELQNDELANIKLGWYDYGARFYDAELGRFITIDPLSEMYYPLSPYGYCAGNSIKNIDVNGEFIGTIIGTVVGAAAGAYDSYKSGGDVWAGAAEGAVSGAIAGAAVDVIVAATVATGGGALVVIGAGAAAGAVGKGLQVAKNSTKAIQGTMSKNITQAATTLTEMGADTKTVGTAVNKITTGMGEAGKNTANTVNKVAAGSGMAMESTIKVTQQLKEDENR